ncbi:UbiH/UbiF/VisC/COQ6 family ubiquinone biosynthesis hydroxylase [Reinekea marina]|uniref:UbiH/UbiF/VisC/COQ6 family ubiquinone biosynthesis hydroxylase n=1 Tax=Reinekea marina TaxID=1310421 RepID=A0ABV7WSW9_9GAMM|nr:UbiH/UbiF/VisC/COQ6 family ubiquinone biosynthesis hydroxylase [Reinekea marina]MDN3650612.1 UbiH/UbiF/VisC/COQ6 family ubiquinone biosynthesis hydroxylase [Reinekea marina]
MTHTNSHDIIISGAGLVGLSLALACAQKGFKIALIEKNAPQPLTLESGQFSPRVSAINHASERFLRSIGVWQTLPRQRMCGYNKMHVWDGLGSAALNFNADEVQASHLGHIIENNLIIDALWQGIYQHQSIDLFLSKQVTGLEQNKERANVILSSQEQLSASLVVGAEGKYSPIRQLAEIETYDWDYQHTAIVTTVTHQHYHDHCAQQVFLDSGPLAFLPLSDELDGQNKSSIVWSVKTPQAETLLALSDGEFRNALNQAFEHKLGEIDAIDTRFSFPLKAQQAKTVFKDRVAIVGDAAHTIHPLAGLGVNLGFLDAAALAQELTRAKQKQIDLTHPFVLRRYQRTRKSHNWAVAALMEALKRGFDTQHPFSVLARNAGMNLLNKHSLAKRPLILAALGDIGTN